MTEKKTQILKDGTTVMNISPNPKRWNMKKQNKINK